MDIVKISFCENSAFYIKNDRVRYNISKEIETNYQIDITNFIEKSYSDKLLGPIINPETLVTFISIGNRYLIYFTRVYNENTTILISIDQLEKGCPKMYICPLSFPNEIFNNTIIYAEMVQNKANQKWFLLMERILVYNNRLNNKYGLDHIKYISNIYDKYIETPISPFKLSLKKYLSIGQIENEINNVEFPIIGLRFYALRFPIVFYFNTNYYNKDPIEKLDLPNNLDSELENAIQNLYNIPKAKNKDKTNNIQSGSVSMESIDLDKRFIFKCKKSNQYGIYNLFTIVNYEDKLVGVARISTIEIQNLIANSLQSNQCYVVCFYNHIFGKFEIIETTDNYRVSSINEVEEHIYNCSLLETPTYLLEEY